MKKTARLLALLLSLTLLLCGCNFSISFGPAPESSSSGSSGGSSGSEDEPAEYTPELWRVTANGYAGSFYLFGSIHLGDDEMFPLPDYVENAYAECGALAVECDIVAFEQLPEAEIAKYYTPFVLTDGTTIRDHLDRDIYSAAKKLLKDAGYYNSSMDYYDAAMWCSLVDQVAVENSGLKYENGIDRHFLEDAHKTGKKILEVESVEFQYAMERGFSDDIYNVVMRDCTDDGYLDDYSDGIHELLRCWKNGTVSDELEAESDYSELTDEERALMESYDKVMCDDRNVGMADAAESYMKQGMNVFFVVGAAHMCGEKGVVALLKARGYDVQPVR